MAPPPSILLVTGLPNLLKYNIVREIRKIRNEQNRRIATMEAGLWEEGKTIREMRETIQKTKETTQESIQEGVKERDVKSLKRI